MKTYGENFGKGMLIGCLFTLIMTIGTSPMTFGGEGDDFVNKILIIASYIVLGIVLGVLGFTFRKEKENSMPKVIGKAVLYVGLSFVLIGICGVIANYIGSGIGFGLPEYCITMIMGIVLAVFSKRTADNEIDIDKTSKIVLILCFALVLISSILGISGLATGNAIGGAMFNTLMISIVFIVYILKGAPKSQI